MVTSFVLPVVFAAQLNKWVKYDLFCVAPPTYFGRAMPFGCIWYMHGKRRWGTTMSVPGGSAYFEMRVGKLSVGVLYIEYKAALKMHLYR